MKSYKELAPDDHPFSKEGLTCSEIEAHFRDAADRAGSLRIIGDLCGTSGANIRTFLKQRGLLPDEDLADSIFRLTTDGLSDVEIARELATTKATIQTTRAKYGLKAASVTPAPKPVEISEKMKEETGISALGVVLRCAAIDTIAELLAQTNGSEDSVYNFTEQVRGVLALIHTIEKEEETDRNETDPDI